MANNFEKAVTGFNHNIKHKGKVYHVQTEDSGVKNAHITTHLFVGGNILASKKTGYADIVSAENLADVVRELMEEQHKEMLRNLVNGKYDDIEAASTVRHFQPGQVVSSEPSPPQARAPAVKPPAAVAPAAARAAPVVVASPPRPAAPTLPSEVLAARQLKVPPTLKETSVDTLFGEDLISEKSLDEVILSYLASDGDT